MQILSLFGNLPFLCALYPAGLVSFLSWDKTFDLEDLQEEMLPLLSFRAFGPRSAALLLLELR